MKKIKKDNQFAQQKMARNQKQARQEKPTVKAPPRIGPRDGPRSGAVQYIPILVPRIAGGYRSANVAAPSATTADVLKTPGQDFVD